MNTRAESNWYTPLTPPPSPLCCSSCLRGHIIKQLWLTVMFAEQGPPEELSQTLSSAQATGHRPGGPVSHTTLQSALNACCPPSPFHRWIHFKAQRVRQAFKITQQWQNHAGPPFSRISLTVALTHASEAEAPLQGPGHLIHLARSLVYNSCAPRRRLRGRAASRRSEEDRPNLTRCRQLNRVLHRIQLCLPRQGPGAGSTQG